VEIREREREKEREREREREGEGERERQGWLGLNSLGKRNLDIVDWFLPSFLPSTLSECKKDFFL
jgi:hypothetical protein